MYLEGYSLNNVLSCVVMWPLQTRYYHSPLVSPCRFFQDDIKWVKHTINFRTSMLYIHPRLDLYDNQRSGPNESALHLPIPPPTHNDNYPSFPFSFLFFPLPFHIVWFPPHCYDWETFTFRPQLYYIVLCTHAHAHMFFLHSSISVCLDWLPVLVLV